jgi:hypothetical protein
MSKQKLTINVLQLIKEKKQKEDRKHQAKLAMAMR